MTNAQLSNYLAMRPSETRRVFNDIREGFEEVNLSSRNIGIAIADVYAYGSTPPNYHSYLTRLEAIKMLREWGGLRGQDAEALVKSGFYDPWVMLQNACLFTLDKHQTADFEALVLNPMDERLGRTREGNSKRAEALTVAEKSIDDIIKPLMKASEELGALPSWTLAGTFSESVRIEINKILFRMGKIDEYGKQK